MPIHDWTRVDAGLFHAFHHLWITSLTNSLNSGILPADYYALPEQAIPLPVPDIVTLHLGGATGGRRNGSGGVATAVARPRTKMVQQLEEEILARKADRITVRHRHGDVVAVIEVVSPGNKASVTDLRAFVTKAGDFIQRGIHLLIIDLFPPTKRDPGGIHPAIWEDIGGDPPAMPPDLPLTVASYDAGPIRVAYVEPLAVGEALPEMPLFLRPEHYILVPLEASYQAAWNAMPAALKPLLG